MKKAEFLHCIWYKCLQCGTGNWEPHSHHGKAKPNVKCKQCGFTYESMSQLLAARLTNGIEVDLNAMQFICEECDHVNGTFPKREKDIVMVSPKLEIQEGDIKIFNLNSDCEKPEEILNENKVTISGGCSPVQFASCEKCNIEHRLTMVPPQELLDAIELLNKKQN